MKKEILDRKAVIDTLKDRVDKTMSPHVGQLDNNALMDVLLKKDPSLYESLVKSGAIDVPYDERLNELTGLRWQSSGYSWKESYEAPTDHDLFKVERQKDGLWKAEYQLDYMSSNPQQVKVGDSFGSMEEALREMFHDHGDVTLTDEIARLVGVDTADEKRTKLETYEKAAELLQVDNPSTFLAKIESLLGNS